MAAVFTPGKTSAENASIDLQSECCFISLIEMSEGHQHLSGTLYILPQLLLFTNSQPISKLSRPTNAYHLANLDYFVLHDPHIYIHPHVSDDKFSAVQTKAHLSCRFSRCHEHIMLFPLLMIKHYNLKNKEKRIRR